MRADLPTGTVTFVFTDVEGSTRLLDRLGARAYAQLLADHSRIVCEACETHGGVVVDTEGDAFFVAFASAPDALTATRAIQDGLSEGPLRIRIGVHTGTPVLTETGYVGIDVHRAARIASAAHGGQIVVSATTHSLAEPAELAFRDVGKHRLKDLAAAEHLYQLGEHEFPPLRSLGSTNLPVPSTPFLGRREELAEITGLLQGKELRLLTLTGPAGTGKSRLALQAAAESSDAFLDGLWWVSLAEIRDAALVLPSIAHAVGVFPEQERALLDTLASRLAGRRLLVLLDNAEHLLPDVAGELAALLAVCPELLLLATSRERIQVAAETVWPVSPLSADDAELMFRERARSVGVMLSADDAVAELCARLDELPLAIELAAARTVLFSPEQLLERLTQRLDLLKGGRDADPRQQTLRAAIDWSYELLTSEEQRVFCALSVFSGGCTFDAAETVAGASPDVLQSLIDKSLVRRRDTERSPRYWMLETIGSYAAERLAEREEARDCHRAHAEWIRALATDRLNGAGPGVERAATSDELAAVRDDYDNARAALLWAWAAGEHELGVGLGVAWVRFWLGESRFRDAIAWLDDATPWIDVQAATARLRALMTAGLIAFFVTDDGDRAEGLWTRALSVARDLERSDSAVWIEHRLVAVAWSRGDFDAAIAGDLQLLEYHRASGDRLAEADTLHTLGEVLRDVGRFEESEQALLEAQDAYAELGSQSGLANNTHSLGDLALDRGDFDAAIGLYRAAIETTATDRARSTVYCLSGIASALAQSGEDEQAARLWGAVYATEASSGFRMLAAERRRYETHLSRLEQTVAWHEGRELSLEDAVALLE